MLFIQNQNLLGCFYAFISFTIAAIVTALAKELADNYSAIQMAFMMYFFGSMAAIFFMWHKKIKLRPKPENIKKLLLLGIFGAIATYFFVAAPAFLSLANYTALLMLTPLIIALLSAPLLGERVAALQWLSIALGGVGALILIGPLGSAGLHFGAIVGLLAAFFLALEGIYFRKLFDENHYRVNFYFCMAGLLASTILMPFFFEPVKSWLDLFYFISLGVLGYVTAHFSILAYKHANAAFVAPFRYTKLLWGVVLGWLFWQEVPTLITWAGIGFIIASGCVLTWHGYSIYKRENS